MIRCSACKEEKASMEFYTDSARANGLTSRCKSCINQYSKHHYRLNKKSRTEYTKRWRQANPQRALLNSVRQRAKAAGIPFDLTIDDIQVPAVCPVLGIQLEPARGRFNDSSPSIDRIIPDKGYIKANVIVVSFKANRIKTDATVEELEKVTAFYKELTR